MREPDRIPTKADRALVTWWITVRSEENADSSQTRNLTADNVWLLDRHTMEVVAEWEWDTPWRETYSVQTCVLHMTDHPVARILRQQCEDLGVAISHTSDLVISRATWSLTAT